MQLGETDTCALVQLDLEFRQLERRLAEAVDVGAHVLDGDGLGAGRLDGLAFGRAHDVQSARAHAPRSLRSKRELHAQGLAKSQLRQAAHGHAGKLQVVLVGGLRAAHAEHAVALPHRTVGRDAHVAVAIEGHLVERVGEMPLVRPELQHVAARKRALGGDGGHPVLHGGHTPHEHAAVVRTTVAHDVVAAFALEIRRGEPARERLGERAALVVGGAHGRVVCPGAPVRTAFGSVHIRTAFASRIPRGEHAVEHGAVDAHDREHVVGRLHAALDLERGHARAHQLGQQVDRAQILRREQMIARRGEVFPLRLVVQRVGKPARLGAQAAVRRAPADER